MKAYPTIDTKFAFDKRLVVFDKLDGSNIRAEWSKKKGFYKFGTRTRLLDEHDPMLGSSKQLILDKYGDSMSRVFTRQKWDRVVAFFEYWGEHSFAGSHEDEEHFITLIDISPSKIGMLEPSSFLRVCYEQAIEIPNVVHTGKLTSDLIDKVKRSTLDGMTFEGVVCKYQHPKLKTSCMFKIKSKAWLTKLREKCRDNDALFRKLA